MYNGIGPGFPATGALIDWPKMNKIENTCTVGLRQDYDQPEETNASDREGVRGHATHGWTRFDE